MTQLTGGGAIGMGNAMAATNALAFANQGMGAAGAASLANAWYNPVTSMRMYTMTGASTINPQTGQLNPMGATIAQLAQQGYFGGSYNAGTSTFNQKALNASFIPGRGHTWMNLSQFFNPTQIQDIQSMVSEANRGAIKGHTSFQHVMGLMNTAGGGPGVSMSAIQSADAQLAKLGINMSTIQKQGNLASLGMAQQQSQSSTYNEAVSGFTSAMTNATKAVNYFLDKTGLGKAIGLVQGAGAGYKSSGMQSWVGGIGKVGMAVGGALSFVAPEVGVPLMGASAVMSQMGGGAASVSTTQPMTKQGSRPGSSIASVPGQVTTAVKDAEAQVGKPYVYGGSNPKTSFDCSGLVQWSYGQAGVKLPRTSQQQWAALKNKSVPLSHLREGDIVFQAGSDGTASAPGHEALYVGGGQIVEAPYTGADIRIRAYNPNEWQHAARPVGAAGGNISGHTTPVSGTHTGNTGSALASGNTGLGLGTGNYGSVEEVSAIAGALASGAISGGGSRLMSTVTNGSATGSSRPGSKSGSGSAAPPATGGGSVAAMAKKMAAARGWTGSLWNDLNAVEMAEAGWNLRAQNPSSNAYGIAQFINGPSEYYSYGGNPNTAKGQVTAFLNYVQQRYHGPAAAWQHEQAYHWYGTGTSSAAGGVALVGERGPELVRLSGGQQIMNAQQTANILRGTAAQPAQAPWTASPAAKLLLDTLTPANNHARGISGNTGGGVTVNLGGVTINSPGGAAGVAGLANTDAQALGQQFEQAVSRAMRKTGLVEAIRAGKTG